MRSALPASADNRIQDTALDLRSAFDLDHLIRDLESSWTSTTTPTIETVAIGGAERRAAPRILASLLGPDWRLSVLGGQELQPIDISNLGALVVTPDRLCPGRVIDLFVRDGAHRRSVKATVIRATIMSLRPYAAYRAALRFHEPVAIKDRA